MKKSFNIFLAALAVMTVSCVKENAPQTDESLAPVGEFELQAVAPADVTVGALGTKTVMVPENEAYAVNWTETDAISVNGTASTAIKVAEDNAKNATFTVSGVSAPFCTVYPAAVASGFDAASATVTLPATQDYVAGSFDPAASVMLGYMEEEGTLAFSHAMSYLYLTINTVSDYDTDNIKSVNVKSLGTEPMSGAFDAAFGAESCTMAPAEGTASTEVTLDCGEAGVAKGTPVVIAIPAGTYASGLVITITDVNDDVTTQTAATELVFKPGFVYTANLRVAAPGIYNVAGYNAFAKAVEAGDYSAWVNPDDDEVNLYADITTDEDYVFVESEAFDGTFDGNGHTITSTDRSLPMFHTIGATGVVKNLNLVSTFKAFTQFGEGAFSGFAKVNLGLIDGCSHTVTLEDEDFATDQEFDHTSAGLAFGGFVWANGGTIQNSTMNGTLNIAYTIAADKNACYGGGFAALGHTVTPYQSQNVLNTNEQCVAGKFISCTNNAYIKIHTNKKGAGRDAIGGICGMAYLDGVEFTGCINAGTVVRTHDHGNGTIPYATSVGGILGQGASWYLTNCTARETKSKDKGFNIKFTNCQNTGTVSLIWRAAAASNNAVSSNNNPNTNVAVGGIVGAIVGNSTSDMAEITNCTTSGYVKGASWTADQRIIVLGGIAGIASYTDLSGNKVQGYVGSGEGVSGGLSTLGAAGGVVGTAVNGVAISGGEVTADLKLLFEVAGTVSTESRYGICLGMAQFTADKSSIKNVSIAPNSFVITTKSSTLTNPTLSKDNFESYLYGKLGASTPDVSGNTWAGN